MNEIDVKTAREVKNLLENTDVIWQDLKVPERISRNRVEEPSKDNVSSQPQKPKRDVLDLHDKFDALHVEKLQSSAMAELGVRTEDIGINPDSLRVKENQDFAKSRLGMRTSAAVSFDEGNYSRPETPSDFTFAVQALGAPKPIPPDHSKYSLHSDGALAVQQPVPPSMAPETQSELMAGMVDPTAQQPGGNPYAAGAMGPYYADPTAPESTGPSQARLMKPPKGAMRKTKKSALSLKKRRALAKKKKEPGTIDKLPEEILQEAAKMKHAHLPGDTADIDEAIQQPALPNYRAPTNQKEVRPSAWTFRETSSARSHEQLVPTPPDFVKKARESVKNDKAHLLENLKPQNQQLEDTPTQGPHKLGPANDPVLNRHLEDWALAKTAREAEMLRRQDSSRQGWATTGGTTIHSRNNNQLEDDEYGQHHSSAHPLARPTSAPSKKHFGHSASAYHGVPIFGPPRTASSSQPTILLKRSKSMGEHSLSTSRSLRRPLSGFRQSSPFKVFEGNQELDDANDGFIEDLASTAESLKIPDTVRMNDEKRKGDQSQQEKYWALKKWSSSDRIKHTMNSIQRSRSAFTQDTEIGLIQYEMSSRRRPITSEELNYLQNKLEKSSTMRLLKKAEEKRRPQTAPSESANWKKSSSYRPATAPTIRPKSAKSLKSTKGKKKKKAKKKSPVEERPPPIKYNSAAEFMEAKFPRVTNRSASQYEQKLEVDAIKACFEKWGMEAPPMEALEKALVVPSDRPAEVCIANLKPQGEGLGVDHLKLTPTKTNKKKKLFRKKTKKKGRKSRSASPARRSKSPGKKTVRRR